MTQQAVVEDTSTQLTLTTGETADRDSADDHLGDEALIADELLVEEVSIDGMCGVY